MKVRKGILLAGSALALGVVGISWAQVEKQPTPAPSPVDMTSREIIDELKKSGHEFVIETTDIPKDRTYEVNLKDLKSEEAIAAIAKAMNLDLVREGNVLVMRSFKQMDREFAKLRKEGVFIGEDGKKKNFRSLTPQEKKEVEAALREVEQAMKDLDMSVLLKDLGSMKDGVSPEALEKAHREMAEAMEKRHGIRAEAMERAHKEMAEAMEKMHESGVFKELAELEALGKIEIDAEALAELKNLKIELDEEGLGKIHDFGDGSFTFQSDSDGVTFNMNSGKMTEFAKTLTKAQLEKNTKQGYLLFSDLTDAQRKMLDLPKTSKSTIVLKMKFEGKEITLRSKRPK